MRLKKSFSVIISILVFSISCNNSPPVGSNQPSGDKVTPKIKPAEFDNKKLDGIRADLNGQKMGISGNILDAKTGNLIAKKVAVSVQGENKELVESFVNEFPNGQIHFNLKEGVKPSATSPIKITVVVQAENYISSSLPLLVTDQKTATFTMKLVDTKNPPVGVVTTELNNLKTDQSGSLVNALSLSLNEKNSGANFSLNLPEKTVLKDAKGNTLSGNIKAEVGFFGNKNPESLAAFPGGLNNTNIDFSSGQKNGYFITGGFTSIELKDEKGNKATTFSKPMEISMQISKGTINPETGKEILSGDNIDIWSYNAENGKWTPEGKGIVGPADPNGNFTVKYSVSHLSYWNIDWFYGDKCNPKLRLIWENGKVVPVNVSEEFSGQYWKHSVILKDEVNDLYNVPSDRPVTFIASFGNQEVGRETVQLGESCAEIQLKIKTAGLPEMREIPVYIGIKSRTEFTVAEIIQIIRTYCSSAEEEKIVLDYFKEKNITGTVILTDNLLNDLEARGVKNTQNLKLAIEQKIRPDGTLYDSVFSPAYSFQTTEINGGKAVLRVFDGEEHYLYSYFYYNNKYYYFAKIVKITPETKEIIIENEDTELTLAVVRDYLQKNGIISSCAGR